MLFQFQEYLTFENIYIYTSFGVLPFWILLILVPNSKVTQIFVNSIILPVILSSAYIYVLYQSILLDESFFDIFKLYLNMDNLYTIFATESFLLFFWIHFLAINLFCGSWIVNDCQKFNIPKGLVFLPLIITYFIGPIGIFIYWVIRIFYAKRINLYD